MLDHMTRQTCFRRKASVTFSVLIGFYGLIHTKLCSASRLKSLERFIGGAGLTEDAPESPRISLLSSDSLSVRTWQWNVGKSDIAYEVDQLFTKRDDNVDLIATCMTEAAPKKTIHQVLEEKGLSKEWALIAYGKHKGIAGGVLSGNSQILSVFLRNKFEEPLDIRTPEIRKIPGMGWGAAGMFKDTIMDPARIPGLLTATTSLHQTTAAGKGGVSARIVFEEGVDAFKSKSIAIVCAHLDSEDPLERRRGLIQILEEVETGSQISELDPDRLDWPCSVFDSKRPECQSKVPKSATAVANALDGVLLMGDLNFRIRYLKDDGSTAPFPEDLSPSLEMKQLFSATGRKAMSADDPLNPWSTSADILVKDSPEGLAFLCDEPYDWLPSYKRNIQATCVSLANKMRNCGQLGPFNPSSREIEQNCTSAEEQEIPDLAEACFMNKKTGKWKLKNDDLQMGWLDRVCFRSVGISPMSFKIDEAYHWDDIPGSDHTAVEMRLTMSGANGMCLVDIEGGVYKAGEASPNIVDDRGLVAEKLPPFKWLQASRTLMKQGEDGVSAQCIPGYHFALVPVDADNSVLETLDRQALTCKPEGLSTLVGTPASRLKCMRYCGPARKLLHGKREDVPYSSNAKATPFVLGAKARYACDPFYELSGVGVHECSAEGDYGEAINAMKCLRTCAALSQLKGEMGEKGAASLQRHENNQISNPDTVVEGDKVSFRCNEAKYVLSNSASAGQAILQCLDTGEFDKEKPKCLAKCSAPLSKQSLKEEKNLLIEIKKPSKEGNTDWEESMQVVEGDIIKFGCKKGQLQGVSSLRCESDGDYVPHGSAHSKHSHYPKCVSQCAAPSVISNGQLSYVNGGLSNDGKLLPAGTKVQYRCKSGCVLLGTTERTCLDDGVFDKGEPTCTCDATLVVKSIKYVGIDRMDDLNHVKLKLYPRSLADNVGSAKKGYDKDSYEKHKPAKMHDLDMRLNHELDTYFFNVELCDSSWTRRLKGTRCHSLAISKSPETESDCPMCFGSILQELFKLGDGKSMEVSLPVTGEAANSDEAEVVLTMSLGSFV